MQITLKESDFKNDHLSPVGKWVIEFDHNSDVDTLQKGIQKGGEGFWIEKRVHFVTKLSLMTRTEGLPMFLLATAYGIAWRAYNIIDGKFDEQSVRGLLNDLGGWDDDDLRRAMRWASRQ